METKNIIKNEVQEIELNNLKKLTKKQLENALDLYRTSASMETYVKIPFALVFVLFLVHNVFIAGKTYSLSAYNAIKTTELIVVGILILIVFVIAGIAMSKTSQLKKKIITFSKRNNIKKQILAEEFSLVAVQMHGGRGIKIR